MSNDTNAEAGRDDTPPLEAWFVVEVDIDHERENPLYTSVTGPFPTRKKAHRERDLAEEAWEEAREEWDGTDAYDYKGWDVVEKKISDWRIESLGREDEESFRVRKDAADALVEGMMAGDDR